MDPTKQQGSLWRLMQISSKDDFESYLEERQQAEQKFGVALIELVEEETLSPVEAGRVYASAVAAIVGHDELIAQSSPGPTGQQVSGLFRSGQPVSTPN